LVPYLHQTPQSTSDDEPWTASLHPVTNHKLHRACSKESAPQEPAPQCLLHRAHSPKACSTELALQEQAPQCLIHRAHSSRACSSLCSSVLAPQSSLLSAGSSVLDPQSSLFKSLLLTLLLSACSTELALQEPAPHSAPQCLLHRARSSRACSSELASQSLPLNSLLLSVCSTVLVPQKYCCAKNDTNIVNMQLIII